MDIMDFNGDCYLDIIFGLVIQYSINQGGYGIEVINYFFVGYYVVKSEVIGFILGGLFVIFCFSNSGEFKGGGSN